MIATEPTEGRGERAPLEIAGRTIGGRSFAMIAGPCAVESREQLLETARAVVRAPARRCSAAARTSRAPRRTRSRASARRGSELLAEAKAQTGLPVVTEVARRARPRARCSRSPTCSRSARATCRTTRCSSEAGRSGCPVLLKRGLSSTLDELLLAAEYVLREGNDAVILCERGIRTFETAYRFTLDLAAVPVLKERTSCR